jgi:hypothetical protein
MMDLMYFGYSFGEDAPEAKKNQADFIKEVKEKFPNVELRDAYDEIKGYRQEVHLDDSETENYNAFLLGKGWFEMSLTLQIDMMSGEKKDDIMRWIDLAKVQYPESFKK